MTNNKKAPSLPPLVPNFRSADEENCRCRTTLLAPRSSLLLRTETLTYNMHYNCEYNEISPEQVIRNYFGAPTQTKIEASPYTMKLIGPRAIA